MSRNNRFVAAVMSVGLLAVGTAAWAFHPIDGAPKTPGGQAAAARHGNFGRVGAASKAINDELKKDNPNKALISSSAATLVTLSNQLPTWFPKGSGQEGFAGSHAKAEIWTDAAGFAAAANNLKAQTAKMQQVAASGDIDAIKDQARTLGLACRACHQKYRVRED